MVYMIHSSKPTSYKWQ